MKVNMKVKDLIREEIDIDVVDDVCEELYIAFCGPMTLTAAGEKQFAEVLEYPVEITIGQDLAVVCVDDSDDAVWEARLDKAKEFFEACAGYCAADDYELWFQEVTA